MKLRSYCYCFSFKYSVQRYSI